MASLKDIAATAGVSVATASMVINQSKGAERISDACATRVRRVADDLGYVPNYRARSMRTGSSEVIGMIMEMAGSAESREDVVLTAVPYWDHISAGVESASLRQDYNLIRIRPGHDISALRRGLRGIQEGRWDGVVVPGNLNTIERDCLLAQADGVALAVVGGEPCGDWPFVGFDDGQGVRLAVEHLAELGHREILWLGSGTARQKGVAVEHREQMFITAVWDLSLRGRSCKYTRDEEDDPSACAESALARFMDQEDGFTAAVCYNDAVAIGALRALRKRGKRVPADVSVVGFDDVLAEFGIPALTTVSHQFHDMGVRAGELVLEMVRSDEEKRERLRGHQFMVQPKLIVRESTMPPRNS